MQNLLAPGVVKKIWWSQ